MFIPSVLGASAPTASPAHRSVDSSADSSAVTPAATSAGTPTGSRTEPPTEPIRHLLFGSLSAVQSTIRTLHIRGYAEPNDWSQPISTGRANEVMAILTKRVRL